MNNSLHYGKKFDELDNELKEWSQARELVPDDGLIQHFKSEYESAQVALIEAEKKYKGSVARKAGVFGFGPVGEQYGVSSKMVRSWHQTFCPDAPDVYKVKVRNDAKRKTWQRREEQAREEEQARLKAQQESTSQAHDAQTSQAHDSQQVDSEKEHSHYEGSQQD